MATQSVKDILETEIPRPVWALRPSKAAPLRSDITVTSEGSNGTTYDASGIFKARSSGGRAWGESQSLLVEPQNTANIVKYSSDVSRWSKSGTFTTTNITSRIDSDLSPVQAQRVKSESGSDDRFIIEGVEATSGNREVFSLILESGTADKIEINPYGDSSGFATARYDFTDDTFEVDNSLGASAYKLDEVNELYILRVPYDTSGRAGEQDRALVYIDPTGNLGFHDFHHAQIEESHGGTMPIVTDANKKARADDKYTIFEGGRPDWWNYRQMTYLLDVEFLNGSPNGRILSDDAGEARIYWNRGLGVFDGNNFRSLSSESLPSFERHKIAVSSTPSELRYAVNGGSGAGRKGTMGTNGNYLTPSNMRIGQGSRGVYGVHKVGFLPTALSLDQCEIITR